MKRMKRHPTDETLAAYIRGSLDAGRRLVVEAHLELCSSCARLVAASDHIAGMLLDAAPPVALEEGSLEKVVARIEAEEASGHQQSFDETSVRPYGLKALVGHQLGTWRWIGPGVHWRAVLTPNGAGARVFMLKARPGTSLPHHTHTGTELTLVLKGAFSHEDGRFAAGDVEDADGSVEHQPIVDPGEECICLVAMEGQLQLLGWMGRIMQPFVRM